MIFPPLSELIPVLQIAIGPVILISGVGLLLLSMTNRLGRVIDRSRILHQDLRQGAASDPDLTCAQLHILWRRADLIRKSIILASVSLLLAACLIITLFAAALLRLDAGGVIVFLFSGCLLALIWALILFIWDINQGLAALKLDLADVIQVAADDDERP
jgi:hypothetical protein